MKQFGIIGLGSFGFFLASRLYGKGHDVIAVDKNPEIIQEIRQHVTQAVVADATDPKALREIGLQHVDDVFVCVGATLGGSVLATLNLREIGCKTIYAKVHSEIQGRILEKLGATNILFPEKDQALQLAEKLHVPNMLDFIPFAEGFAIVNLKTPTDFIDKNLRELDLVNRFGTQVLAVRKAAPEKLVMIPKADYRIEQDDALIILGPGAGIEKLQELA